MTAREMQRSITPGSVPYGERQGLEEGLAAVAGGPPGGASSGAPGAAPGGGSLAIPEDPIGALLNGDVQANQDLPITDGLSVGPGAGPLNTDEPMLAPRAQRLRMLATQAASPQIRSAARRELRRLAREGV